MYKPDGALSLVSLETIRKPTANVLELVDTEYSFCLSFTFAAAVVMLRLQVPVQGPYGKNFLEIEDKCCVILTSFHDTRLPSDQLNLNVPTRFRERTDHRYGWR